MWGEVTPGSLGLASGLLALISWLRPLWLWLDVLPFGQHQPDARGREGIPGDNNICLTVTGIFHHSSSHPRPWHYNVYMCINIQCIIVEQQSLDHTEDCYASGAKGNAESFTSFGDSCIPANEQDPTHPRDSRSLASKGGMPRIEDG